MTNARDTDTHEEISSPLATPPNEQVVMEEAEKPRTPLPKFQLALVMLMQFAEPITALVIHPFINQFVRSTGITGGDDRKTGYYAGMIESAFFLAEGATVFYWGRLSDRIGRKPVLLLGPLGLTFAMLKFGYSTSFLSMVVSRCFQGVFNGNIGVSKTVIVELTDETNIGDAFAMIPLVWSISSTIVPIMGGTLSNPAERWPNVFGKIDVFRRHPYLLPCSVSAAVAMFAFIIAFLGFKETHPTPAVASKLRESNAIYDSEISHASSTDTLLCHHNSSDYGTASTPRSSSPSSSETSLGSNTNTGTPDSEAPTLSSVLRSKKMKFIIINYLFLTFTEMAYSVLTPLIYSTKIELGGLGLDPYHIGMITGTWGLFNAFAQIVLVGKLIKTYGASNLYRTAYASFCVCVLTYPVSTYLARRNGGISFGVCASIFIQLLFQTLIFMGYSSIHVVTAENSPKSILGSINGVVQMAGCAMRTVAPTISSSLFSLSLQKQLLGGNLVYVVLFAVVLAGVRFSLSLPDREKRATLQRRCRSS